MPKRDESLLLKDIAEAGNKIFHYTTSYTFETFSENSLIIDAVVRNFEVIGEASKRISDKTKVLYPDIEWKRMTQFRNILIHDYFGIELRILWDVVQNHLPKNIQLIEELLGEK